MNTVDVLAVLRGLQVPRAAGVGGRASRAVPGAEEKRDAAIAAVAELIAQRDAMANALVTYRKAGVGNSTDFMLQHEASVLAGKALARVGGES